MNVALVGSSGYISGFLIKNLKHNKNVNKIVKIDQNQEADLKLNLLYPDIFDYDAINDIDYIIFTAAISSPDMCATDYEYCEKINVIGTRYFIKEAIKRKCKVIFFASDAVFGDKLSIFNEDSETCACTPYGIMKKAVEDEFKYSKFFKSIRLSYVISNKDRFVSYCLKCIEDDQEAEIFHPFYRNCITISDVITVIVWLLNNWDKFASFCLNIAGCELVSRIRIADEINRIFNDKLKYKVIFPESNFFNNRPKITQMSSKYLYKLNILENISFTEKFVNEFKEN